VTLSVLRDGEAIQVPLTPRQKGDVEGKEIDLPRWDMTVKAINRFDNPDLHFHREQGVFIFGTRYPGNASNAGLTEKDIILKIDGEKIESIDDIKQVHKQLIDNIDDKHRVLVAVLRDGLLRQVVLDFKRDYKRD
jgi:S1-C subfamily serine protease